jgi:DNA helicase HerA-like ATPase
MAAGKGLLRELSAAEAALFMQLTQIPALLTSILGLGARFPAFSTVVSNVPGPRNTLYWNGARLDGIYPASIVFDGFAMNITLVSYHDHLDFGIVACRRSMPQIQRIIDHLEDALQELEAVAGIHGPERRATDRRRASGSTGDQRARDVHAAQDKDQDQDQGKDKGQDKSEGNGEGKGRFENRDQSEAEAEADTKEKRRQGKDRSQGRHAAGAARPSTQGGGATEACRRGGVVSQSPEDMARILVGGSDSGQVHLDAAFANRHGLIAGATGTGKTVTLQVLAEGFSRLGVPVFLADVKGDLSGLSQPGKPHAKVDERVQHIGIDGYAQHAYPVAFWDLFAKKGAPVRTTLSEMGPQLLARLLDLNDTQEGVLTLVFEFADQNGMLMLDLADLRTTLSHLVENRDQLPATYRVATASVNAILRRLLVLEREGGRQFFGEPALALSDLMQRSRDGRGVINVLAADTLIRSPRVYATFLLWLLSELFEELPEIGDPDRPVLVFFFDEAHLLFKDAPRALLETIEQVVRLIRSKGVGVYFVTQSPADIPDTVLGQLGNRIQHALRAYTPKEQKAVRVAAESFRANPQLDTAAVISELGVGEALVSTLQRRGVPSVVQRTLICPPASRIGKATLAERQAVLEHDPNIRRYGESVDRESAHEQLLARAARQQQENDEKSLARRERSASKRSGRSSARSGRDNAGDAFVKSMARSLGSATGRSLGRKLFRGILGSLLR